MLVLNKSDVIESSKKFASAMQEGFFYLEMPADIKPLIKTAINFGNHFHQDQEIRKLSLGGFNGLHVREDVQVEAFYLEERYWSSVYSEVLNELAVKMAKLTIEILRGALQEAKIAPSDWALASGGASDGEGMCHLTFNHYRPDASGIGLKAHRDFGLVTLLFINQKGLQASVNNQWEDVDPMEGHFIVNFGQSLEKLVNDSSKLTAALHRVQKVAQDRISFGIFLDNHMQSMLYKADGEGKLESLQLNFGQFIQEQFKISYDVDVT